VAPVPIVDGDTHLFEPPTVWADHLPAAERELAVRIERDERGYHWLAWRDRRLHLAAVHVPGDLDALGTFRRRWREGAPPAGDYEEALPPSFWEPAARLRSLDEQGIGRAVCFPNYGLFWPRTLDGDRPATLANMAAWNRWAAEVAADGGGRLLPVGHVHLGDARWLDAQLRALAGHGIRMAMVGAAPVDGRPLSHPDLAAAWAAFVEHGMSVVFHVHDFARPFDDAWYAGDVNPIEPRLMSTFISTPAALALADLAANGVLARPPALRVGVVEFTSAWLPGFLRALDTCFEFHHRSNGTTPAIPERPSAYVRRQVRVATFGFERPDRLAAELGDVLVFGSDWPHAEGVARPLADFAARGGPAPGPETAGLYAANAGWLLHEDGPAPIVAP